jgi:hypothetical protein
MLAASTCCLALITTSTSPLKAATRVPIRTGPTARRIRRELGEALAENERKIQDDGHPGACYHRVMAMKGGLPRILSSVLFLSALVSVACLLAFDVWFRFQPTPQHRYAGALALILIGASFVCAQLGAARRRSERLKGILLGTAFALWGCEQYLARGALSTAVDSLVVTVFVVDLALVIFSSPSGTT